MKLIEKLNQLDKNSYCKYDLVNLYLVTNNNKETLQKLSESIDKGISAEEAYKILSEDFMDEMPEDELDVVEYEDGVIMEDPDLVASGFNSATIDLIQKNYDLVQSYDSFLNTLDAENVEDSEDYKEIIQSAIDTTNNNIGKLSAIQNDLQPGTEEIYTGMKDAEETLAETESPVDESLNENYVTDDPNLLASTVTDIKRNPAKYGLTRDDLYQVYDELKAKYVPIYANDFPNELFYNAIKDRMMFESFTLENALSLITPKDWDRAYSTDDNRLDSMLNKITDKKKLIGRIMAMYIFKVKGIRNYLWTGNTTRTMLSRLFNQTDEKTIKEEIKKLDLLSIPSLQKASCYEFVKARYDRDNDRETERIKAKLGDKNTPRNSVVNKAIKELLALIPSTLVMYSSKNWNSYGGRIGNYSHTWYTASGNKMSDSRADDKIYDCAYNGGYFFTTSWDGGYAYGGSIKYNGGTAYELLTNAKDVFDQLGRTSDQEVSIYRINKLKMKDVSAYTETLVNKIPDITMNEIMEAFNAIDKGGTLRPKNESLNESRELVLPSKILDEFIKLIEANNYSIDSIKDNIMGGKHFQVTKLDTEFIEMPTTNELRLEAASLISAIHAFETKYGETENTHSKYPVIWNFGMDDNHHLTAGIDVYGGVADEEEGLTEDVVNEAKLLKCETCGGNIEPDENGKFGTCDHCGNRYKIDESLNDCYDEADDEESFYNKEGEEILTEDEDSEEPSELDYIDDDVSDLENKFKVSYDIQDFEPWSGAVQPFQNIVDAGKLDEFYEWVEKHYASGLDEQILNDLLWYKTNTVYRNIGMEDYIN